MGLPNETGIYPFYKPKGMSSYDVIRLLKRKFPHEKIGHGGTLDPLAEGVLVIAIGKEYTKKLQTILKGTRKTYITVIELGKISETDDGEGVIKPVPEAVPPTQEHVDSYVQSFVGHIQQVPPRYSAVKIDGEPAYKRARRGENFTLKPKRVVIEKIDVLKYEYPFLTLNVVCQSGVYIRSLARDIGEKLETGGYMKSLVRKAVGHYSSNDAIELSS
ncbi:tRNA pseudouridine(55) synthase TruB [Candidatus Woesebacteria bacterium]|nr:tRNA pseudouridine(55) synthase TruB [Candidatus Woesebacteria bacterium]